LPLSVSGDAPRSVTVAHARLIKPAEIRAIDAVLADGAGRAQIWRAKPWMR